MSEPTRIPLSHGSGIGAEGGAQRRINGPRAVGGDEFGECAGPKSSMGSGDYVSVN